MKQRLVHPKSILKGIVLTLVTLLFLQGTQTSALAGQPQVAAGYENTMGVKSDGTVVAVGDNRSGQNNFFKWNFNMYRKSPWPQCRSRNEKNGRQRNTFCATGK
mgnify:CR=1 FL=1